MSILDQTSCESKTIREKKNQPTPKDNGKKRSLNV